MESCTPLILRASHCGLLRPETVSAPHQALLMAWFMLARMMVCSTPSTQRAVVAAHPARSSGRVLPEVSSFLRQQWSTGWFTPAQRIKTCTRFTYRVRRLDARSRDKSSPRATAARMYERVVNKRVEADQSAVGTVNRPLRCPLLLDLLPQTIHNTRLVRLLLIYSTGSSFRRIYP
jgi:hypothetical protein